MILSILIPTIPQRSKQFGNLFHELEGQRIEFKLKHDSLGEVEIIYDKSKKFLDGGKSIGKKRNDLLKLATGKYICFLDDDDNIAPNYLETLVRLCHEDKDVVTFRTIFKNDHYWTLLDMSLQNPTNEETTPERIVKRTPWHICPVRSEFAKMIEFSNLNHNEDWTWLKQVLTHIKSEAHTDVILTQYNHSEEGSEADKIVKSEVMRIPHYNHPDPLEDMEHLKDYLKKKL